MYFESLQALLIAKKVTKKREKDGDQKGDDFKRRGLQHLWIV